MKAFSKFFNIIKSHIINYPTPASLHYLWSFGSLAGICLVIQIVTGIFLAMHYVPTKELAFSSVEHIMRNVNFGWLIRYFHANGASVFFIAVYLHIFRGLFFRSYERPRISLWYSGVFIFLLMMATAFLGYVLPWGQMSLWGATVITNLFSAIPLIGENIVQWIWGGYAVDEATLKRFFSIHFVLPFLIVALVMTHLVLLHMEGSSNPSGVSFKEIYIFFTPYFGVKDLFVFFLYIGVFSIFVYYFPNLLGHPDNYIPADAMSTPEHIVPEWYFLPFYAILRSIPNKLGGVVAMICAILIWLLLPFLNRAKRKYNHGIILYRFSVLVLFADFLLLGWLGQQPVENPYTDLGLYATIFYFLWFLIIIPFLTIRENIVEERNVKYQKTLEFVKNNPHLRKECGIYTPEEKKRYKYFSWFMHEQGL